MFQSALIEFKQEPAVKDKPILALMELTMRNLLAAAKTLTAAIFWHARRCWPRAG